MDQLQYILIYISHKGCCDERLFRVSLFQTIPSALIDLLVNCMKELFQGHFSTSYTYVYRHSSCIHAASSNNNTIIEDT